MSLYFAEINRKLRLYTGGKVLEKEPLGTGEIIVYIIIGIGSLMIVSYLPHMFLDGLIEDDTKFNIQVGVTVVWFFVLAALGWDIGKARRS
jgi:hypothetical protein